MISELKTGLGRDVFHLTVNKKATPLRETSQLTANLKTGRGKNFSTDGDARSENWFYLAVLLNGLINDL